ncbi:unnamed protein product [Caretta caretta]
MAEILDIEIPFIQEKSQKSFDKLSKTTLDSIALLINEGILKLAKRALADAGHSSFHCKYMEKSYQVAIPGIRGFEHFCAHLNSGPLVISAVQEKLKP